MGNGRLIKSKQNPLFWMLVLHGLNEGFIPLYHPAQFPACTAIVALSTGALHWLAHCPDALLCALSPERNLSPEQHRRAAGLWSRKATESPVETPGRTINPPLIKKCSACISTFKNLQWRLLITRLLVRHSASDRDVQYYRSGLYYWEEVFLKYNNARADVWSVALGNTRLVKIDIAFNISFLWQITSTEESLDKSGNIWMWRASLSFDCATPWPQPVFEREAATWYGGGLSGSGYGALLTQYL